MSRSPPVVVVAVDGVELGRWPLARPAPPGRALDLAAVDALCRLRLAARRLGWDLTVQHPCAELEALLELAGLRVEVVGQAEHGEDPVGVEEAVDPVDPAV